MNKEKQKSLFFRVDEALYKRLKILAINKLVTVNTLMKEIIDEYFKRTDR
jgi:predicted DNA-binding protein